MSTSEIDTKKQKLSTKELDEQASNLIAAALERTNSAQRTSSDLSKGSGSFGRMSFSSMMGGLSLSLSRTATNTSTSSSTTTDERESRGRTITQKMSGRSVSQAPAGETTPRSQSRARSQSPFSFRRFRKDREQSPTPQPIPLSHSESDVSCDSSPMLHPRSAFSDDNDNDSGDETVGEGDAETDDDEWSDDDAFDDVTEMNTERNALVDPAAGNLTVEPEDAEPDPLGEGVNVVVPPEPYFPTTLNNSYPSIGRGKRNPRRRKSVRHQETLPLETSRPIFQRDRCTITLTQGDPEGARGGRRPRRYVIASDMSEESRYAIEWGVGTVLRDGDEMLVVSVVENESKIDPIIPNPADRASKLRCQQERQGVSYILVRQVISLLQRTKLHVKILCQAWHAKNARHMILDIVDYFEPIMLIVGSRGLTQLKGILLGSTSHYLIQKCSVPVMVARRRLRRPPRRAAHLATHRAHVSLAEAAKVDRVAGKVDEDVKVMKDEMQRERDQDEDPASEAAIAHRHHDTEIEEEGDDEDVDEGPGVKIAG